MRSFLNIDMEKEGRRKQQTATEDSATSDNTTLIRKATERSKSTILRRIEQIGAIGVAFLALSPSMLAQQAKPAFESNLFGDGAAKTAVKGTTDAKSIDVANSVVVPVKKEYTGMTFNDVKKPNLAVTVKPVKQENGSTSIVGYVFNALSDKGIQYQVILVPGKWAYSQVNGKAKASLHLDEGGWRVAYNVFNKDGTPSTRENAIIEFPGTINPETDTMSLSIAFVDGKIRASVLNENTGVWIPKDFDSRGATYFVGGPYLNGFKNNQPQYDYHTSTGALSGFYIERVIFSSTDKPVLVPVTYGPYDTNTFPGSRQTAFIAEFNCLDSTCDNKILVFEDKKEVKTDQKSAAPIIIASGSTKASVTSTTFTTEDSGEQNKK